MVLLFENLRNILTKDAREKSKLAQFEASISDIPFDHLEELPIGASTIWMVFLVEKWDDVKVGLTHNIIRYVEQSGNSFEGQIRLNRSIDPFHSVDLKWLQYPHPILRLEFGRFHDSRESA